MSTDYHPQTDGQTEVTNQALGDLFRCLVGDNIKSWVTKLCKAEFSHNHAINRTSGHSPFQVVYGLLPRCPLDLAVIPDKIRFHGEAVDFVSELEAVHRRTMEKLEQSVAKYKASADTKRREVLFKVGDQVWVYLTKEIMPLWEYNSLHSRKIGQVKVVECINPNAYRVRLSSHIHTSDVFNVKHLSRFHGDNDPLASETKLSSPGGT